MIIKTHLLRILIILILPACNSSQEQTTEQGELQIHESFFGMLHGKGTINYPSGNIHASGNWKYGWKNGEYKEYFEDGNLLLKSYYINDILQGNFYKYYPNGSLREFYIYRDEIVMYGRKYDEYGELTEIFYAIEVIESNEKEICMELLFSPVPIDSLSVQVNLGKIDQGKFYIGNGHFSKTNKGNTICIPKSELGNSEVLLCHFCEILRESREVGCFPFAYNMMENRKIDYKNYIHQESKKP